MTSSDYTALAWIVVVLLAFGFGWIVRGAYDEDRQGDIE